MKTKTEAEDLGKRMLQQLPAGWRMRVRENLGWYVTAHHGPISVSPHFWQGRVYGYSCLISDQLTSPLDDSPDGYYGCGSGFWTGPDISTVAETPAGAVLAALREVENFGSRIAASLAHIRKFAGEAFYQEFLLVGKQVRRSLRKRPKVSKQMKTTSSKMAGRRSRRRIAT